MYSKNIPLQSAIQPISKIKAIPLCTVTIREVLHSHPCSFILQDEIQEDLYRCVQDWRIRPRQRPLELQDHTGPQTELSSFSPPTAAETWPSAWMQTEP